MSDPWQRNPVELADSTSIMDDFNIHDFIKNWWTKNVVRANGMSIEIQKITNEYLEIGIDGNFFQLTIPHNFSTNSSADGIISNADCGFIVTLAKGKNESNNMGSVQEILTTLNEKLDRISCHGNYSFGSVLDSVMDTLEKYKNCSDCEGSASEIYDDEDSGTSDCEGHSTATTDPIQLLRKKGYFYQLVEKANGRCDQARLMAAMSARVEMPCKVNEKDNILRWSKAYLPSHQDPHGVRFEIELTGILSDEYRHRHGHVFEALGFSFSTPLLIEVKFDFCKINFESTNCGLSLGDALQEVSAWHEGVESKVAHNERNFASAEALPDELYEPIHKVIDGSRVDRPVDLYGLRFLLPRMTKDFFSDPDHNDNNNVLLASEGNIFVRFLLFIGSRLNSLLKRCIVCNKELPFTVSKLCSCADKLCLFGFEELGWGTQVLQELKQKTVELIDLEISLALAATDFRRDVFEPFPPFLLWDREIRYRSGLFDNIHIPVDRGNKNMVLLGSIIHSFPPVSEMRLCVDEVELKEKLANSWLSSPAGKSIHKQWVEKEGRQLPYNVLRFILCTNRMSLVFISENDEKLIKDDKKHPHWKCYQFAVVHDSPEREAYFESSRTSKLRECHPWYSNIVKKHKSSGSKQQCSKFSFHGSLPHNWYSIMRNGVRCLSRTHLMWNGSQGGPGIYLAKYFNKSANFSFELPQEKIVSGWKNGLYKDGFYVVSICELIACPVTKYRRRIFRTTQGVRMVPKEYERCVAVRYLLVITCTRPHKDLKEMSSCRCYLGAGISDGKTLYDRHNKKINLHQHYQRLRQKYLSTISEIEP